MKKIILFFAGIFLTVSAVFAQENLYTIQNVKKDAIKPYVESALNDAGYSISKKDPYFASTSKDDDNITIILQKSGNNVLYYYNSSKNKKVDKNILKSLKNAGISYNTTDDENYLNIFNQQAQNISSNTTKSYSFDVWNYSEPATAVSKEEDDTTLKGSIVQIEKGTTIPVYLQTPINTANAQAGDSVVAILTSDLVYNGHTVAPQGSSLSGTLSKARHATYGSRNGRVVIDFNTLTTIDGKTYKISTEAIDFTVTNDGKLSKTVKNVATGAVIGALGGLIVGAITQDAHIGRAVLIGTSVGAASGTVSSVAERGVDAEIPVYTELEVKLTKPFKAVFY